jgi:hypothetical protein
MGPSRNAVAAVVCCGLALSVLGGCGSHDRAAAPETRRPSLQEDPCAERLHDLSGRLLLYYSQHGRLPAALDALPPLDPASPTPPVCPASGRPYVYAPAGVRVPDQPGRLVLYDAQAIHAGMRWGVFVDEAPDSARLTARVILVPEDAFRAAAGAPSVAP